MNINQSERLRAVRTFPSLVKYLREYLDWPIQDSSFEDLTFDYTFEELGIDANNAAKINYIKRLRPLVPNQPWGIFFVSFEPKQLPIMALRRILNQVVVKKKVSTDREGWESDDLLFISNYGETDQRQISIANFSNNKQTRLPTLKVLGWDNLDTGLHLDYVANTLHQNLAWPDNVSEINLWKESWRGAFTIKYREQIKTSQILAKKLAQLAIAIRDRINKTLYIEISSGPLRKLMKAFQEALIDDLTENDFADMYAQTIAYGLLSDRINSQFNVTPFKSLISTTSPFLKDILEVFLQDEQSKFLQENKLSFDELGVNEIIDLLDNSNFEAIIREFGNQNPKEDPVIHFYEQFLKEYDEEIRLARGVFYTPHSVVCHMVNSVDALLRSEFDLEDGLADTTTWGELVDRIEDIKLPKNVKKDQPFVQILDPATGTGTYLVQVIDVIYKTLVDKWKAKGNSLEEVAELWNDYVPEHLLPRLYGYELLMAPYTIAHLKISTKLFETGYRFKNDERIQVYLTNALEPENDQQFTLDFIPALAHEAQAVNKIKRLKAFTVVIGNPPYSGHSKNHGEWILKLIDEYKYVDGNRIKKGTKWLQDDYVKFFRLAQFLHQRTNIGILSFITNHSYLDAPTFRGMRQNLIREYQNIRILDLHGNTRNKEIAPDGVTDKNVFEIQQGVAIGHFWTGFYDKEKPIVRHKDLWGSSKNKYDFLISNDSNSKQQTYVHPLSPFYSLIPQDDISEEYFTGWKISDLMPNYVTGVTTSRDNFIIGFSDTEIKERLIHYLDPKISDEWIREKYNIKDNSQWSMSEARKIFQKNPLDPNVFVDILVRPFDLRRIYYDDNVVFSRRYEIMQHMLNTQSNIALMCARSVEGGRSFDQIFCTRGIATLHSLSIKESNTLIPLYLFHSEEELSLKNSVIVNLDPLFINELESLFNWSMIEIGFGDLKKTIGPEDIISYIYGLLHSTTYRNRYKEFLSKDFPYIFISKNINLFRKLTEFGREIINLHLLESPVLNNPITQPVGSTDFQVEKVSHSDNTVWINKARNVGFRGVSEEIWNFLIGGYKVCEKWLKDREVKGGKNPSPGKLLTKEDIRHYQKIIVSVGETIRIIREIDELIDQHGGWEKSFIKG